MKKRTMIFMVLTGIAHILFASTRMGRPLYNSPADMQIIVLEPAVPQISLAALHLLAEVPNDPRAPRVTCFNVRGHITNTGLHLGSLLPINLGASGRPEVKRKEKEQKAQEAELLQSATVLTEDEQREAAAYKQKLDAGDLKQQVDKQQQVTQEGQNDEEIGNYL